MSSLVEEAGALAARVNGGEQNPDQGDEEERDEEDGPEAAGDGHPAGEGEGKKKKKKGKKGKKKKGGAPAGDHGDAERATGGGAGAAAAGACGQGGTASGRVGNGQPTAAGAGAQALETGMELYRLQQRKQMEELTRRQAVRGREINKEHAFWDTQPVPKQGDEPGGRGEIDTRTIDQVRAEPYNMPPGFEWCCLDVGDEAEIVEMYTLLSENYVEDDDNMFRFDYSKEFLRWALTPPGFAVELHVGVRNSKNGKLMGLITAVPTIMRVHSDEVRTVEINFLCVHKKLRSKRLAPVLIKEITRRVNRLGIWQAVYTAGIVLPTPVTSCRYFHRSLNPKKLIEVGFSRLANRMTMARTLKLYKLPERPSTPGIRSMTPEDVGSAHALLMDYLNKFHLAPMLTEEEFAHWLLPREGVVDSFVVTDRQSKVTDMCSFYHLPSTVIGNDKHQTLYAAYSFYNVATTVPLVQLMCDSLVLGRDRGMDVFNALNLMENADFLQELKFGIGDGHLQYYLYNWRCPEMKPKEVGLVLL